MKAKVNAKTTQPCGGFTSTKSYNNVDSSPVELIVIIVVIVIIVIVSSSSSSPSSRALLPLRLRHLAYGRSDLSGPLSSPVHIVPSISNTAAFIHHHTSGEAQHYLEFTTLSSTPSTSSSIHKLSTVSSSH